MSIPMIATVRFRHRGQMVEVGTSLFASPIEAAAYLYQRLATFPSDTPAPPVAPPPTPVPRRRYRRRDLTAEESS